MRGGMTTPSRTSAGLATTVLDTAFALHLPTTHCVRAGLGRPQSRGGVNGRHQGKGLGGRCSAISLPLGGDIREKRPLPSALYPAAPHVRRRSVARLSEHTGGLGAPQAVGLEAPPRVVVHSGGERIGMRDEWGISNAASSQRPPPPYCFIRSCRGILIRASMLGSFYIILENTLGHRPLPLVRRWGAPPPP